MIVKKFRTARIKHRCEECHRWAILPGHRYEIDTVFPGHDIAPVDRPMALKLCVACACDKEYGADLMSSACGTFCHGVTPCALPFNHNGDHSCREDARAGEPR